MANTPAVQQSIRNEDAVTCVDFKGESTPQSATPPNAVRSPASPPPPPLPSFVRFVYKHKLPIAMGVVIVLLILEIIFRFERYLPPIIAWMEAHQKRGLLVYFLLCIGATLLALPASTVTLLGGAAFGFWRAWLVSWTAISVGQVIVYVISALLLSGPVSRLVAASSYLSTLERIMRRDKREAFRLIFLLRLSGFFPYALLNYASPHVGVPLGIFAASSALGIGASCASETYAGSVATSLKDILLHGTTKQRIIWSVLLVVGGTAGVICVIVVSRMMKRMIQEKIAVEAALDELRRETLAPAGIEMMERGSGGGKGLDRDPEQVVAESRSTSPSASISLRRHTSPSARHEISLL